MRRSVSLRDGFIVATVFAVALLVGVTAWAQTGPPPDEAVEDAQDTEELEQAAGSREPRWDPDDEPEDFFGARPLRLTASTGFDFTTGDFGSDTTSDIWYVPFAAKLEWEPFIVKLTVPYLRIDGNATLVGDQPQPNPDAIGLRDGIGDIVLAASYVYFPGPSVSFLPLTEITYKVKFGTADEDKDLGTGEIDHTVQLDLSKRFGIVTPFVGGGYKFIGDPPGTDLKNKGFAYVGLTARVMERLNLGLAYDWSQSSVRGGPTDRGDFHEISPFASIKLGKHFAIDPYGVIGLSKPAPDWGIGMQLRFIYDFE
jgi:hypothetical protein